MRKRYKYRLSAKKRTTMFDDPYNQTETNQQSEMKTQINEVDRLIRNWLKDPEIQEITIEKIEKQAKVT